MITKETNGKEQSKWIVESTHLRMLPEMEKPTDNDYNIVFAYTYTEAPKEHDKVRAYNEALSKQPTIKRGDNGQWSIGDVKIENEDFEVKMQVNFIVVDGDPDRWSETDEHTFSQARNDYRRTVAIPKPQAENKEKTLFKKLSEWVAELKEQGYNAITLSDIELFLNNNTTQ